MTPVVLPAASPATPSGGAASHAAVLATVPDAPPAAARLEAGSVVTGTVLGRDAQGLVAIRTDKGVLALATNANLPVGSTVSLEVRVAGARMQVVVLSIEPPPGPAPTPLPAAGTPGSASPAAGAGAQPTVTPAAVLVAALGGGGLVAATVVRAGHPATVPGPATGPAKPAGNGTSGSPSLPQAGASAAGTVPPQITTPPAIIAAGAAPMPRGTLLAGSAPAFGHATAGQVAPANVGATPVRSPAQLQIPPQVQLQAQSGPAATGSGAALLSGTPAPGAGPSTIPGSSPASPAAPGTAAAGMDLPIATGAARLAPPDAAAPLTAGSQVAVRIHGAALPGETAPMATPGASGTAALLTATVAGQTPAGHPVVDSAAGRLVLAVRTPLPAGTTLLLEIASQPAPGSPGATAMATTPHQALLRLAHGWPALGAALAALGAAPESAAAQALATRLPQTGPGLAAGMVSMMARLAAGDAAEWLPPAVREALSRSGRRELADRLQGEFKQLSRLAGEPMGGDWRVMFLPLRHEGGLHQINLYLRGQRHGGDEGAPDTGTRFIVEIDMTRLGPIQLDGLVHGRRFDLMLRSRLALSEVMRRDIEAIFETARGIGGFAGTIGFQTAASFPVQPLEQAKRNGATETGAAEGVVV